MDEPYKRLSMNTILMNARIFDQLSSEEDSMDNSLENYAKDAKKEPDVDTNDGPSTRPSRGQVTIKEEPIDMEEDSRSNFPCNVFEKLDLKKEYNITPVKLEVEDNSNEKDSIPRRNAKRAVFSKESPFKETNVHGKSSRDSPYKTRQSPYKRPEQQMGSQQERVKRKRNKSDLETDPEVLRRRQKQIDYGKNTVGYDIYIQTVPKSQREPTDPQTPDKYHKYSRRGFDGLIKQWRLKLHKYDPPEDE